MLKGYRDRQVTRRRFVIGSLSVATFGTVAWSQASKLPFDETTIDPVTAHKYAISGELTLLDIRRPDEWAATGSGKGAHRLDMRRDDFVSALDSLLEGDRTKPIAVICAGGVRSNLTSQRLKNAGFTNVIDVPEGMLGSSTGPGWLKRGLPLNKT